jgi:ribonuclease HII
LNKRSKRSPDLNYAEEQACFEQGYRLVAGIDEVGRGCLAGPVVASAVVMPRGKQLMWYKRVKDSKLLTPQQREELSPFIHEAALTIGTGVVEAYLIDQIGMTAAVHLAMHQAVNKLLPQPEYLLIDYLTVTSLNLPQKGVADGDTLCFSIACASIVAKVYRDHLMQELDRRYPGYGLAGHKGYGTEEHMTCLRKLGPSPVHRRLFQPVRNLAQLSFKDWISDEVIVNYEGT